ncbi:GspE/PulE family protein [Lachnospira pectinoschiza]|uniref:Type IV pilus assembly protein PilB n=1 Tax=Lachnospira pectinoschiza TaxID=28052 RepID=A0A1G9Z6I1_9FIRM|nr:ATPase, T2SS/T4P/T4SS family [Lachnospira pectinoschiza]SDN16894.1 type IV pilus assembly protein PilB [Lachnospira pectinoschiza]
MNYRKKVKLGSLLVSKNVISNEQLDSALKEQRQRGLMLGETIVALGFASQSQINEALCESLGIEFVDMRAVEVPEEILNLLDDTFMRKNLLVPLGFRQDEGGSLKVAMADPTNIYAMDDVNIITGKQVIPYLADGNAIKAFLDRVISSKEAQNIIDKYKKEQENAISKEEEDRERDRQANIESAPIVVLINNLIEAAVRNRASDIHIEPFKDNIRVRYRIDGSLREVLSYESSLYGAIITRIKIISGMDISEKRKPQDGRITINVDDKEYDIRVSGLPTIYGEKFVMRIAAKEGFNKEASELGFSERDLKVFNDILKNPHGIILVTGPTGSGKSTTLYTALSSLNKKDVNIITVEDPVEANIDGVNQVQVNTKANLTFANALRSILRQDPDIIMIGEIRDSETAKIAVRASITGHLVVSTLHTNSTAATVARLEDMGVENYMIADSVVGIIAQRLVRKLCSCKQERQATDSEKKLLGKSLEEDVKIYEPVGCKLCNGTGYYGRTAIYEIMKITPAIKKLIIENAGADRILEEAKKEGMLSLKDSASLSVLEGVSSMAEMIKATYETEDY